MVKRSLPVRSIPLPLAAGEPQDPGAVCVDVALTADAGPGVAEQLFTYVLPPALAGVVGPGHVVRVPFAQRREPLRAVVFAQRAAAATDGPALRQVLDLQHPEPLLDGEALDLARYLAAQTCCGLGQAVRPLLPPGTAAAPRRSPPVYFPRLDALPHPEAALARAPAQWRTWQALCREPGSTAAALAAAGCPASALAALVRRGLVERRAAPAAAPIAEAPQGVAGVDPPQLTEEQAQAVARVTGALDRHGTFLLWGVTGSGKTEVYLRIIAAVLAAGRQALCLVPEIALTPQMVAQFQARFGATVAVLHSGLGEAERAQAWWRIRDGGADVVVGARSAVFAPLPRLGVVIVDEEHEASYRQEEAPRYHARDVGRWRAARRGVPLVLGSATPDVGTFAAARSGAIALLTMTRRVGGRALPRVAIVDRRTRSEGMAPGPARGNGSDGGRAPMGSAWSPITPALEEAIDRHLARGAQVLLLLNRRGFAPVLLCAACGFSARCQRCAVSLCYHQAEGALRCHYCHARRPVPRACPRCGGAFLWLRGAGTERLAAEVAARWPTARVARMDLDTTRARDAHRRIYEAFRAGEADVLVGTQMVAKGWDVPGVTLVGVVDADTALHHPDYRSAERTFQLLCQVAGRAGRGEAAGEVIIQTYSPEHPAIAWAAAHDYAAFAEEELAVRRQAGFPPFAHLVRLLATAPRAADAEAAARAVASALQAAGLPPDADLWGPGAAPLSRLRGAYRWQLVLRAGDGEAARRLVAVAVQRVAALRPAARLTVDPDPLSLL
jgi:primosomal protein N' (replication factor Y)